MNYDPILEYQSFIEDLRKKEVSFSLATVINVQGSASAKTGSKAVFDKDGKNIFGWIGGGCAERFVGEQSIEALQARKGRVVLADLDDEIFGLGVACGGKMEIFIDPIHPQEKISLNVGAKLHSLAQDIAKDCGIILNVHGEGNPALEAPDLFLQMGQALSEKRGKSFRSLRELKELPVTFAPIKNSTRKISLLGKGRIVESLEKYFSLLNFQTEVISGSSLQDLKFTKNQMVAIASHSPRDSVFVKQAAQDQASYIGMIGSRTRALEIIEKLNLKDQSEIPLYIPAGLDLDAQNPSEMALSIVCEVLHATR